MKRWILLFAAVLMAGCATQSVEQTDENGRMTKYRTSALFNKTAMTGTVLDKTTPGGTKQLFGQTASSAETQAEAISALFDGMMGLFNAGVKAGVKTAAPVSNP